MFIFDVYSLIKLLETKLNQNKKIVKMFQMKSFVACVILLVMWQHIEAGKLNKIKSNKRYDEALQTDIYESIYVDNDMQADATTVYPPLIEEPSKPVSIETNFW